MGYAYNNGTQVYTFTTTTTAPANSPIILVVESHTNTYADTSPTFGSGSTALTCNAQNSSATSTGTAPTTRIYTCPNPSGVPSGSIFTYHINASDAGILVASVLTGTATRAADNSGPSPGSNGTLSSGSSGSGFPGMALVSQPAALIAYMSVDATAMSASTWSEDSTHGWTTVQAVPNPYNSGDAALIVSYKLVTSTAAVTYAPSLPGSNSPWMANAVSYDYTAAAATCPLTRALLGVGC